mmetsp:Transcript_60289/g.197181  ORF Transcript_60289/g.197181 Transcript_60289/m.197181 type:complete len:245 (+) Transcript_60289:486-1220(+)
MPSSTTAPSSPPPCSGLLASAAPGEDPRNPAARVAPCGGMVACSGRPRVPRGAPGCWRTRAAAARGPPGRALARSTAATPSSTSGRAPASCSTTPTEVNTCSSWPAWPAARRTCPTPGRSSAPTPWSCATLACRCRSLGSTNPPRCPARRCGRGPSQMRYRSSTPRLPMGRRTARSICWGALVMPKSSPGPRWMASSTWSGAVWNICRRTAPGSRTMAPVTGSRPCSRCGGAHFLHLPCTSTPR